MCSAARSSAKIETLVKLFPHGAEDAAREGRAAKRSASRVGARAKAAVPEAGMQLSSSGHDHRRMENEGESTPARRSLPGYLHLYNKVLNKNFSFSIQFFASLGQEPFRERALQPV